MSTTAQHPNLPSQPIQETAAPTRPSPETEKDDDRKLVETLSHRAIDYTLEQLCKFLGVDPNSVRWDAATETVDGDVQAVIGNILRAKFGEDWGPSDGVAQTSAERGNYEDRHPNDMVLHPLSEIREWDEALAVLGIQDSDQTPADAIRERDAEIEQLRAALSNTSTDRATP